MAANAAAAKKKLEEKFTKILRELVSIPANRNCFDCGQRGPTYVNMTVGSYVCTTCSGLLRGLNPPHRIKSITMATFTQEEIDFLKSNGNEISAKAYLALFDNKQTPPENSSKNPQAVRDFLTMKYERRQWYVAPSPDQHEEMRRQNNAALVKLENDGSALPRSVSMPIAPKITPVKQDAPPVNDKQDTASADRSENEQSIRSNSISQSSLANAQATGNQPGVPKLVNAVPTLINAATKLSATQTGAGQPAATAGSAANSGKLDLLADFGDDPFAPGATTSSSAGANFAQFEDAFGSTPFTGSASQSSKAPAAPAANNFNDPFDSAPFGVPTQAAATAQKQSVPIAASGGDLSSLNLSQPASASVVPSAISNNAGSASKYAALAELDELFKSTSINQPVQPQSQVQAQPHTAAFADPFAAFGGGAQFLPTSTNAPFANQNLPFGGAQFAPTAQQVAFTYPTNQAMPFGNVVFAAPATASSAFGVQLQPNAAATAASNPFAGVGTSPPTAFGVGVIPATANLFAAPATFGAVFDASAMQPAASFAVNPLQPAAFGAAAIQPAGAAAPNAFGGVDWKADFNAMGSATPAWPNTNGSLFDAAPQGGTFGVSGAAGGSTTASRSNPFL